MGKKKMSSKQAFMKKEKSILKKMDGTAKTTMALPEEHYSDAAKRGMAMLHNGLMAKKPVLKKLRDAMHVMRKAMRAIARVKAKGLKSDKLELKKEAEQENLDMIRMKKIRAKEALETAKRKEGKATRALKKARKLATGRSADAVALAQKAERQAGKNADNAHKKIRKTAAKLAKAEAAEAIFASRAKAETKNVKRAQKTVARRNKQLAM